QVARVRCRPVVAAVVGANPTGNHQAAHVVNCSIYRARWQRNSISATTVVVSKDRGVIVRSGGRAGQLRSPSRICGAGQTAKAEIPIAFHYLTGGVSNGPT